MRTPEFERLVVCLSGDTPVETLLGRAARFAALVSARVVDVVAAPAHDLHGSRRGLVAALLGSRAGAIHLAASVGSIVDVATAIADDCSAIVTGADEIRRLPRRLRVAALVLPADVRGRSVIAVVDPETDTPAVVTVAVALASRMQASKVVVCHPWFDEASLVCEDWEARAHATRLERLTIFLARVPSADTSVHVCAPFTPVPERTLSRLAAEEHAALIVTADKVALSTPLLVLPSLLARPRQPTMLAALWHSFLDGPLPA